MIAIYEPKGKALEYAPLALNLYDACPHGCTYCYCPAVLHRPPASFFVAGQPREGILAAVERDAKKLAGDSRRVLLSFTSDPYQESEREHCVTYFALQWLQKYGLKASVLTKNPGLAVEKDITLLCEMGAWLGTTLTGVDAMEPHAPTNLARIVAMNKAHDAGITTWVSFEPVICPEDTLRILGHAKAYADFVKIGRWNYDKRAKTIDWTEFLYEAMVVCERMRMPYYIKNDLWKCASEVTRAGFKQSTLPDSLSAAPSGDKT